MAEEKRSEGMVSLTDVIDQLDMGQCSAKCNRELREVLARLSEVASENGKASGSLTLTLTFATAGQSGQTDIGYSVSGKPPTAPTAKTVLYVTAKGGLTSLDPRQKKFQFADTSKKTSTHGSDAE